MQKAGENRDLPLQYWQSGNGMGGEGAKFQ